MNEEHSTRRLKIDLSLLDSALDGATWEHNCYLDRETGDILMVNDETRGQLEDIYEGNAGAEDDDTDSNIEAVLAGLDIPDWEKELLRDANRIERDRSGRYTRIPHADSSEAYRDMEDFIETVGHLRLRDRLYQALGQRRPFRRFKDVLENYPEERERWFSFSNSRIRERGLEWLKDEGIEPV